MIIRVLALVLVMATIYWGVLGVINSVSVKVNYRFEQTDER